MYHSSITAFSTVNENGKALRGMDVFDTLMA